MDETDHLPIAVGVRCAGWLLLLTLPFPFCGAGIAPAWLGGMLRRDLPDAQWSPS